MPIYMDITSSLFGDGSVRYELISCEHGLQNIVSGGSSAVGKVVFSDLSVMLSMEKSTPKLVRACATGVNLPAVQITFCDGSVRPYFIVRLENSLLKTYHNSSGGDRPTESLSFSYAKISWKTLDPETGEVLAAFAYDLRTGKFS